MFCTIFFKIPQGLCSLARFILELNVQMKKKNSCLLAGMRRMTQGKNCGGCFFFSVSLYLWVVSLQKCKNCKISSGHSYSMTTWRSI